MLVAVAAANLGVLLLRLRGILHVLYLDPDTAAAPMIATLGGHGSSGGVVKLGNYPAYDALWFLLATRHLPAHRRLWEGAPVVLTFVALALLVWTAWRVFGRLVALTSAAILVSLTPFEWYVFFTLDTHGSLLLYACALLALLVWLIMRNAAPSWWLLFALAGPVTALTSVGVAADDIAFVAFLIPFMVSACLVAWRVGGTRQRRIAAFAVVTGVAAVVVGELLARAMHADHWVPVPLGLTFVKPGSLFANFDWLVESFTALGGGYFFGAPLSGVSNFITFMAGVLSLLAVALVLGLLWRRIPRLVVRSPKEQAAEVAATVYVTFWAIVLVGVSGAFVLSSAPIAIGDARYVATAYIAVAALVPLILLRSTRTRQILVVATVAFFGSLALHGTITAPGNADEAPAGPLAAAQIEQFALAHGARYGYARYYDAPVLTWETNFGIDVFPVYNCGVPRQAAICSFYLNRNSLWYAPRPNTRTFLIIDKAQPDPVAADPASGQPTATATFGSLTVNIYNHDIASTMGP